MNDRRAIPQPPPYRKIYSVSQLTTEIKSMLEDAFPFVWITGEISNFRMPASGHHYFVLKDTRAQISAVIFRGQNRNLGFTPEDGMQVTGLGRISLYEPRGSYQVIFEYIEPKGVGAIQIAFEQLKAKLSAEGLFDDEWKQRLPYLPRKIGVITSPTGAVIHDIAKVLDRRFSNLAITIFPVRVQGDDADKEIVAAIRLMNARSDTEVAILARGGGSLGDLAAFNSEIVARAVFESKIPIISAVGHETDYTIADFVADLRAPTPSAGAELVIPSKIELLQKCDDISDVLRGTFRHYLEQCKTRIRETSKRLIDPRRRVHDLRMRNDDMMERLTRSYHRALTQRRERLNWRNDRLLSSNPINHINILRDRLEYFHQNMVISSTILADRRRSNLRELAAKLMELSPKAILSRGYSITRTIPDLTIVKDTDTVSVNQDLQVLVERGAMTVKILKKQADE